MPITAQGPITSWGRAFPITGAPLIGAPLANPAAVMNEALERAERWAEVACFQSNHSAVASAVIAEAEMVQVVGAGVAGTGKEATGC